MRSAVESYAPMNCPLIHQDRQCNYNVAWKSCHVSIVAVETYSECVSIALVILHAKHICRIILPFGCAIFFRVIS